jgi:hypothetical protein
MKTVDNFKAVRDLLKFDSDDDYYFIEILQRKKDFAEGSDVHDHTTFYEFYVASIEKFDKLEKEIKMLCKMLNARAYINLNKKSKKKTAMLLMRECLDMIENENFNRVFSKTASAAGQCKGTKDCRKFLLDVDTKDATTLETVLQLIETVGPEAKHTVLPSVNGYHVVSTPFDVQKWNDLGGKLLANVEIKHNAPTVLYYCGDESNSDGKSTLEKVQEFYKNALH